MIDTQAVKNKILNLAMRGQLTEQIPKDESAEELYAEIIKEKAGLVKEGKIKKEKNIGDIFDEDAPFDIPSNWKWCKFGSVIVLVSGTDFNPEDYNDVAIGIPYVTGASNFLDDGVLVNRWTKKPRNIANEGDVLLVCKGSGYGKTAICDITEAHIARQIMAVKKTDLLNMKYVLYFLKTNFDYIKSKGQGLIPGIDRKSVLNMNFPLPPTDVQDSIVEKIEVIFEILDKIDALQNQYASNQEALKSKLIDAAIQGKLTEQLPEDGTAEELVSIILDKKKDMQNTGIIKKSKPLPTISEEDIPFKIPESWMWVHLDDITTKITSGNTPTGGRKSNAYVESGNCFFREQNVYNDGIHQEGMVYITDELLSTRENSTVLAKDILLNITGGSIGRCALIPDDFGKGSINQHILIIRLVDERMRFYVHRLLCSPYAQKYIKNKSVGDKDGFSGGRCKRMLVPIPPLAEQQRIAKKIDEVLSAISMVG